MRKFDANDKITQAILDALDDGQVPWRKPWKLAPGMHPQNALTKRPYTGINALILGLANYEDPRWITYKKAAEAGGQVRAGQNRRNGTGGTTVVWWKPYDRPCEPEHAGDEICNTCAAKHPGIQRHWSIGYHTVFNVEQIDGLDLPEIDTAPDATIGTIARAENIVDGYSDKPSITHNGGDRAFYRAGLDSIHMPPKNSFADTGEYYATLLHELSHSTGHESRLNRHGLETGIAPFGSEVYSREELAAEFGASFLCHQAGIDNTLENSTAYITGWARKLRSDRKLVIMAASQGQRAANYILGQ